MSRSPAHSSQSVTRRTPASSPASSTCATATSRSRAAATARPRPPACRACSRRATSPITCIVRPSRPQEADAWRRSMRTNTSTSITAIDPAAWDALVGDGAPFLRHAFLAGLESSGCVGGRTGWTPAPILLHDERGLAAAAPAYIKAHSFGEFVFDFSWAQAYAQHGLDYYPKLVIGVPFTPATAPRLLVRPDLDAAMWRRRLVTAIEEHATAHAMSSAHGLFVSAEDAPAFDAAGWLARGDVQFHWHNQGYADYDAFLETFTTKFRKNARRERRRVAEAGVTCET